MTQAVRRYQDLDSKEWGLSTLDDHLPAVDEGFEGSSGSDSSIHLLAQSETKKYTRYGHVCGAVQLNV